MIHLKKGLHGCELLQREDRVVSEGGHQGGQRDRVQWRNSGLVVTSQPSSLAVTMKKCPGVPTRRLQGQYLPQIWNGAVLPQLKGQEC